MGWFSDHINQKCPECGCHLQEKSWSGGGIIDAILMSIITAIVCSQAKCPLCGNKYAKQRRGKPPVSRDDAPKRVSCAAPKWLDEFATSCADDYGLELTKYDTVEQLVETIKEQLASVSDTTGDQPYCDAVLIGPSGADLPVDKATALLREHGCRGPIVVLSDHPMTKKEQCEVGCDDYVSTAPVFGAQFMWEIVACAIADSQQTHGN